MKLEQISKPKLTVAEFTRIQLALCGFRILANSAGVLRFVVIAMICIGTTGTIGRAQAQQQPAPQPAMFPQPAPQPLFPQLPCQQQGCRPINFAAPFPIWGVDSAAGCGCGEVGWDARGMIPWQEFAQGEYVGHARTPHVPEYRLREGDLLAIYYRRTREELSRPYELQVGDRIRVESLTAGRGSGGVATATEGVPADDTIARELVIQPDGTITLPLLGQVRATRLTVPALRKKLEELYGKYYRAPAITVTPIAVNTRLEDLLNTVDSRAGTLGGLQIQTTVTPAGNIQLPGVGSVFVQNLTLEEARQEIDAQYDANIPGVHVTLVLSQRANASSTCWAKSRSRAATSWTRPPTRSRRSRWRAVGQPAPICGRSSSSAAATIGG